LLDGISLIPNIGIHTQKIPPITSNKDNNVSSAAGINFEPIEYKINPRQTKVPCSANKLEFLLLDKKSKLLLIIIIVENKQQKRPAKATVVNFGVSFLHLNVTEKIEKPTAEVKPKRSPVSEPREKLSKDIMPTPMVATIIVIQTLKDIFSFKNKKPNKAVINGIEAKHNKVIAAVVFVIDQIKVIIADPSPTPPIVPEIPI